MKVLAFGYFSMRPSIAVVEQTSSATAITSSRHSGCAITTASAKAARALATFAPRSTSCVGQQPSYTTMSFSGTCFFTQLPRLRSGVNRTLSEDRLRMTEAPFAVGQQPSYTTMSFSGTCFFTQLPRLRSGVNFFLSEDTLQMTEASFADVHQI